MSGVRFDPDARAEFLAAVEYTMKSARLVSVGAFGMP